MVHGRYWLAAIVSKRQINNKENYIIICVGRIWVDILCCLEKTTLDRTSFGFWLKFTITGLRTVEKSVLHWMAQAKRFPKPNRAHCSYEPRHFFLSARTFDSWELRSLSKNCFGINERRIDNVPLYNTQWIFIFSKLLALEINRWPKSCTPKLRQLFNSQPTQNGSAQTTLNNTEMICDLRGAFVCKFANIMWCDRQTWTVAEATHHFYREHFCNRKPRTIWAAINTYGKLAMTL